VIDYLSQIINARYLIAPEVVDNYIPLALACLCGIKIEFEAYEKNRAKADVIAAKDGQLNTADKWDLIEGSAPENSIAIIPIQDEIFSWRTMELVRLINLAENNPNIIAVLFLVNTPGGMVFYTDIASEAIKAMQKPKITFVLNMAASAGMWLISATDRIIMSSQLDRVGSIGVMTSMMDFTRMFRDKLGIDKTDLYATKSTGKNLETRTFLDAALEIAERTAPIIANLDFVNEIFHQAIHDNLGIDLSSEVFTGKMYFAKDAIDMGLAHEINSFEYAANLAYKRGLEYSIKSFFNSKH